MPETLTSKISAFKRKLRSFYKAHRRSFPWRETCRAYEILVSEIMLQQTQTERVRGFYDRFLKVFPTTKKLAAAPTPLLLAHWKGLGYNRRAFSLRAAAQMIEEKHAGNVPESLEELLELPGIGKYTAQAIQAFAFNKPAVMIETNIRTVLIHEFYPRKRTVSDQELETLLLKLAPRKNSRNWYYAMMDYGVWLKSQGIKTHRKSKHYKKQSAFKGSRRELRGLVLKILLSDKCATIQKIVKLSGREILETKSVINELVSEGFLCKKGSSYSLSA